MSDYKRILVKLSGERFGGDDTILDVDQINLLADELVALREAGYEVAVTVGGGNILRGHEAAANGIEEGQAHYMGMLALTINALALQSVLEQKGVQTRVMTGLDIARMAEPFIRRRATRHIEKGRIVIFASSGQPFMTSDTVGALRSIEISADLMIKASRVDGIYTSDPESNPDAQHIPELTYKTALVEDLRVMDGSAIAMCQDNKMPLMVTKVVGDKSILKALKGEVKRTLVRASE
ncbi:MAG: UMP kinase [Alphaproteobacteria bacterium]|nr:UMP kinase [Alphaproteobacteria bacterium]MDD9919713.1 UMP kinase [Alphaproteobacteria bacterium]